MTEPLETSIGTRSRSSSWTIFLSFLRLGCTSFGGPIAHLGYFRNEFVVRRKWLDEATYADIVGLCQFLPGPASSQVGFTIGLLEGGPLGALAAWTAFTLPSALVMFAFAYGHNLFAGRVGSGILHGLELVAVAVIAQAVWGMMQTLAPDRTRGTIAVLAAGVVLLSSRASSQLAAITLGAILGLFVCREASAPTRQALPITIPRFAALISFARLLLPFFWRPHGIRPSPCSTLSIAAVHSSSAAGTLFCRYSERPPSAPDGSTTILSWRVPSRRKLFLDRSSRSQPIWVPL
jgi:chromate transporter